MTLVPQHQWTYQTSGYSKHDDKGHGVRFGSQNFWKGGKRYDASKPYPKEWTHTRNATGKIVAVPDWCKWVHEDRIEYPDGTWRHRWIVHVPGYGYAWPLDRIITHDRIDCWYGDDQPAAKGHGLNSQRVTIYEVTFKGDDDED